PGMRTYPNQEPREAVTARVTAGIEESLETYPNKKVLLVSHGGAINAILSQISGGEIGTGKTKLSNACLSNIIHDGKTWTVKDYAQRAKTIDSEGVRSSETRSCRGIVGRGRWIAALKH